MEAFQGRMCYNLWAEAHGKHGQVARSVIVGARVQFHHGKCNARGFQCVRVLPGLFRAFAAAQVQTDLRGLRLLYVLFGLLLNFGIWVFRKKGILASKGSAAEFEFARRRITWR